MPNVSRMLLLSILAKLVRFVVTDSMPPPNAFVRGKVLGDAGLK